MNTYITSDATFALADVASIQAAINCVLPVHSPLRVAISVREWNYFRMQDSTIGMNKYIEALQAVSIHLVEKYDAKITYISTCQGIIEYTDDSKTVSKIVEALPENIKKSISVYSNFHLPAKLAEMMKNYNLVIATRLHIAILSLGVGTPVLPIAYKFKARELFERIGLKPWVQNIEDICTKSFTRTLDSSIDSLPHIRQRIFESVEQERECALESSTLLKKAFEKWQSSQIK